MNPSVCLSIMIVKSIIQTLDLKRDYLDVSQPIQYSYKGISYENILFKAVKGITYLTKWQNRGITAELTT